MADKSNAAPANVMRVSEAVQEQIHFDRLWATAQGALALYAGQRWSARGDDDPGVTLLQALAYGVSDVSYRHTLPLIDLLTAPTQLKDARITLKHEGSLFASEFGPEWSLTSSPVTLADYRKAILDLVSKSGPKNIFCFRDVQIALVSATESYQYTYDETDYAFHFVGKPDTQQQPQKVRHAVAGQYRLWVTLTPGMDKTAAEKVLQRFLKNHRNLCEWEIVSPVFVKVEPKYPRIRLHLQNDVAEGDAMEQVIAQVMWVINQALLPVPVRQDATTRLKQGERAEHIYVGPRLTHGWISHLPPERGEKEGKLTGYTIPVQTLSEAVVGTVPGIAVVEWEGPQTVTVEANTQTQLWVDFTDMNTNTLDAIQLYRHGQWVPSSAWNSQAVMAIYTRLNDSVSTCTAETPRRVPEGRYRNPGFYRTVGASLPSVYGLQQDAETLKNDADAVRLFTFMRLFEQLLANRADQLNKLPRLLAFDGRDPDAQLWGASDWPQKSDDPLAYDQTVAVFGELIPVLQDVLKTQSQDNEKELAMLDHLLGYFGEQRASRALNTKSSAAFRHVQQGALRQITRLAYERAAISISKVSALQRKIAARLGVGPELFDETLQQQDAAFPASPLPFYVIEHQELLPATPTQATLSSAWTSLVSVESNETILTLAFEPSAAKNLKSGMLIELKGHPTNPDKTAALEPLAAIVIHAVHGDKVEILLAQHARLGRSLALLKNSAYTWQWRVSSSWLKRVVYDVSFHSSDPTKKGIPPKGPEAVLDVGPSFPVELNKPGTRFALRPKGRWLTWPTKTDLSGNDVDKLQDIVVQVVSADPILGTVTVKWVGTATATITLAPPNGPRVSPVDLTLTGAPSKPPKWDMAANPMTPYAWVVPYKEDSFAFTLSLVLDRRWLVGSNNPEALSHWIAQIVREEMPSHLNLQLHWLSGGSFDNFAAKYQMWQNDARPVGDQSYELLSLLGIGERPVDTRSGIGFARIVKLKDSDDLEQRTQGMNAEACERAYQQAAVVYVKASPEAAAKRDTPPKKNKSDT
ncbi:MULTISPECIES: hypothetical protein [Serratia]|uniref:hypothetical protein n=1 Tax=Serratia TaxID=613 RepID=UPI0013DD5519|nr:MULTISPECIES: hypothetical protein [Serratia]MBH2656213.1 hypothetical protein [Serratia ureilytica]MBJ2092185.1 hypothetical protein [Serratia ureilytica]